MQNLGAVGTLMSREASGMDVCLHANTLLSLSLSVFSLLADGVLVSAHCRYNFLSFSTSESLRWAVCSLSISNSTVSYLCSSTGVNQIRKHVEKGKRGLRTVVCTVPALCGFDLRYLTYALAKDW